MSIVIPWPIRRIFIINTIGSLPLILKSEQEDTYLGSIVLKENWIEFCLCNPDFLITFRVFGMAISPAPFFGSNLMKITTPRATNNRGVMFLLRIDRSKTELGEVSEELGGIQVPTLKTFALIQVRSFHMSYDQLHGKIPDTLLNEILEKPVPILQRLEHRLGVYNCRWQHN